MKKTILITGATDGIGLETAKLFAKDGHTLLLHGRNSDKVVKVAEELKQINSACDIKCFVADLSLLANTARLAREIVSSVKNIDVIINNAGVYVVDNSTTADGLDVRFAVNTISPYLLTKKLLPKLSAGGRVINLSSAAQSAVNFSAMQSGIKLSHDMAYAQSKLAITMWGMVLAEELGDKAVVVSINPKSFLGSKMVKEAYGRKGYDLSIGADILYRGALSNEFADRSGAYYDNDYEEFSAPHPFAMNRANRVQLIETMSKIIGDVLQS